MDNPNKISESASNSSQPNNADQNYYTGPNNHLNLEEIDLVSFCPVPDDNEPFLCDESVVCENQILYKELQRQFEEGVNANLVVKLGDHKFPCHSEVIQCYSQKFSDLNGIAEIVIEMDKCSFDAFLFIYDWMLHDYSSPSEYITRENILDILQGAEYLEINELIEQCMAFIQNKNNFMEHSACNLFLSAKTKKLSQISDLMLPKIDADFLLLVSTSHWLDLDVKNVTELLQSDYIYVNCEIEIFMAAVRWLRHDWSNRQANAFKVLNCVRFKHMNRWELSDLRSPSSEFFVETCDLNITKLIREAFDWVAYIYAANSPKSELPNARNWSGAPKTHDTYRDFIIFLEGLRKRYLSTVLHKIGSKRIEHLKNIIRHEF